MGWGAGRCAWAWGMGGGEIAGLRNCGFLLVSEGEGRYTFFEKNEW
jgi:hypothetical protein